MELSFLDKLKFSYPYVFVTRWCTPLNFQTQIIRSNRIHRVYLYHIGMDRYKDQKNREGGKSILLKKHRRKHNAVEQEDDSETHVTDLNCSMKHGNMELFDFQTLTVKAILFIISVIS